MKTKYKYFVPLFMLLFAVISPTVASAQASHGGTDLRISLDYSHVYFNQDVTQTLKFGSSTTKSEDVFDGSNTLLGVGGTIALGYRWKFFGLYFEQDLSAVYPKDEEIQHSADTDFHFLGGTYLVARGILPLGDRCEIDLGVGIGVMYSDGDSIREQEDGNGKTPIIVNEDGESSAAFALKATAGITFFFTNAFGMGVDFDYSIAFNKISYDMNILTIQYKVDVNDYIHHLKPALHFRFRF